MTDARAKQIHEIEQLLAERRKYEQWLAQLEARKESTPSHVFVKVHRDYTVRLTEAQAKLSSESGAVHALAAELEESLGGLERQITERTDERAEAELRASVGEFAGKEWDKLRVKLDSAIADLSGERDGIQRELDTLRALLTEAEPLASAGAAPKTDVDDIAFLRSVLGRNTPYSSTPLPAVSEAPVPEAPAPERKSTRVSTSSEKQRPSIQAAAAPQPAAPVAQALQTAAPVTQAAPAPIEPPAPAPEPVYEPAVPRVSTNNARASSVSAPRASTGASATVPRPSTSAPELFATPEVPGDPSGGPRGTDDQRANRPSGTFGQPTPRTSEALKSLKCQECGTLNFPTEWYCERCGGELAAF